MGTKKKRRKHSPSSQTHRVARSYTNGRRWVIQDAPKPQSLPEIGEGEGWYVVRVPVQRERKVEEAVGAKGYPVFVPRFIRTARRQRQERTTEPVLAPGYLFVALDGSDEAQAEVMGIDVADIRRWSGTIEWSDPETGECFAAQVRGGETEPQCEILRSSSTLLPLRIPEPIMQRFVQEVSAPSNGAVGLSSPALKPGTKVDIKEGPFCGLIAEVQSSDGDFAKILISMLGQSVSATFPLASLQAA
jgi:transcription antitermination factor NusG